MLSQQLRLLDRHVENASHRHRRSFRVLVRDAGRWLQLRLKIVALAEKIDALIDGVEKRGVLQLHRGCGRIQPRATIDDGAVEGSETALSRRLTSMVLLKL